MVALTKTITLHCTQSRIERATRRSASACLVALAIADRGFGVVVGFFGATVSTEPGVFAEYRLPPVGRALVRAFDAGERVAPTSFRITRADS